MSDIIKSSIIDLLLVQQTKIGNQIPVVLFYFAEPYYQFILRDRKLNAGGIMVFLKKLYKIKYSKFDQSSKSIILNSVANNRNINLISSYNPHFCDTNKFLILEENLQPLNLLSPTLLIGDLNNDMLTNKGDNLPDTFSKYILKQMINSPTHFQGNPTLIDVVFVNDVNLIEKNRVIERPESYHCFILIKYFNRLTDSQFNRLVHQK